MIKEIMVKIKEKIKSVRNWVKSKAKKILITTGIISVALAAEIVLQPEAIPFKEIQGQTISFPYTDDNTGENLINRTDKETYGGQNGSDVYVMVKNESGKAQNINLQLFFENNAPDILEAYKLVENIAYQADVPDFKTTDYDCSFTSSTTNQTVVQTCQKQTQTGTHKETRYRDEWQSQILSDFSIHENNLLIASKSIPEKDKKGYVAEKKIVYNSPKSDTSYYKIKIKFPRSDGKFHIETVGDEGGYGLYDPYYSGTAYLKALVIAGGGGGGADWAGGGGAGGYLYDAAFGVTEQAYSIVVGAGGTGGIIVSETVATAGATSSFSTLIATGGGFGASSITATHPHNGGEGGSGGGGHDVGSAGGNATGTAGQGSNGGAGFGDSATYADGGGGGGASTTGANANSTGGGNGGAGLSNSISGTSICYAGGGGGGGDIRTEPDKTAGTASCGGSAGTIDGNATTGTANTGGGGGGAGGGSNNTGGAGGKGVVIISYVTADFGACTGGATTTSGSDTVHTFTSSGTFTVVYLEPPISQIQMEVGPIIE